LGVLGDDETVVVATTAGRATEVRIFLDARPTTAGGGSADPSAMTTTSF